VPTADRQKATVLVRIGFEPSAGSASPRTASKGDQFDPRILPDMGVKVTFLRNADPESPAASAPAQPVTLVPKAAIRTEGDQSFAFVVSGETAERRAVRIGGADGDRLEVVGGLRPGEVVVVAPPAELSSGAKIQVK
jgi:hypothetical protein